MTGNLTSAILQSQSLKLVTIVIAINVVIGGFSGEDIKNVAMFMKKIQFWKIQDLRPLKTCSKHLKQPCRIYL